MITGRDAVGDRIVALDNGADDYLTRTEYGLLEYLMRHPAKVLSRAQILKEVWGFDFEPASNTLDVYVMGYSLRSPVLTSPVLTNPAGFPAGRTSS